MIEKIFYVILIIFAFFSVQTPKLRRSVVYLAVFSAVSAFTYILMGAPDAALAEAVIGSTIATVIYLAALNKYRVFMVYLTDEKRERHQEEHISRRKESILLAIENFCILRELEPQIIYTVDSVDKIKEKPGWDLIVSKNSGNYVLHGREQNYHVMALKEEWEGKQRKQVEFIIEKEHE
ncbi:MAG: DUF4040 domain-containing protein [Clostridia bacterium]|nr:DUF4040 domain-containing protein [Clostridia bacterium]